MPRQRKPYLHLQITRHGKKVWYFRRHHNGPRIRILGDYNSPEFSAAYDAAYAGQPVSVGRRSRAPSKGTLAWLIDQYRGSNGWAALAVATRSQRDMFFRDMIEKSGSKDIEDIDRAAIVAGVTARKDKPNMANVFLGTVRALFDWAVGNQILETNPCDNVKGLKAPKASDDDPEAEDGHITWSDEELARFEQAYPIATRERLAYSVFLYTGLRLSDAARLGKQHLQKDGTIKIKTQKRGVTVQMDIVPPLRRALDAGPHGKPEELAFLTAKRSKRAFRAEYLGAWFANAARAIGLEERTAHGIRKAAARRYAENGATVNQLMAIFGWTDPKIAMHYVAMADRKRLALDAQRAIAWD
jgi:integrase